MERVDGIGGFFFRARDPKALAQWYCNHLGIALVPQDYEHESWFQHSGPTVFAPFPADTTFLGRAEKMWMLNFRVLDLAAMVAQLKQAGVDVEVDSEGYPNGLFARFSDPEGNPIQLWEPRGLDAIPW